MRPSSTVVPSASPSSSLGLDIAVASAARAGAGARVQAAQGHARRTRTLGTKFSVSEPGSVVGLRLFRTRGNRGARSAGLWLPSGQQLGSAIFPATRHRGWQTATLSPGVTITPGAQYVVGYVAPGGRYSYVKRNLARHPLRLGPLTATESLQRQGAGAPDRHNKNKYFLITPVFVATPGGGSTGAAPGAPSNEASTLSAFPNSSNTGVPAGTTLTTYAGPMTITQPNTVIDKKVVNGDLFIRAANVTITNTVINGRLSSDGAGSVTVADSEVDGGNQETYPSVSYSNLTLRRVEVTGGQHSVQCSDSCTVVDSWLHDQYIAHTSAGHVNAFISNGGSGMVLRHNSLFCEVQPTTQNTGCTADASLFGDFGAISDVVVDNNLFKANSTGASYCLYAGYNPSKPYGSNPAQVRVTNNVFERGSNSKCGIYGPVTSYLSGNGNVFSGNVWQDNQSTVAAK